jgi:GR25 family glycosyltransferase involved in LPS biosynthesis
MPYPATWNDVLHAPAFIINLERRPDRWQQASEEVKKAGFRTIQRWNAVDYKNHEQCEEAYSLLGKPLKHPSFNNDFNDYPGTWGVFLSQTTLWKKIVDERIPYACIFEDDVLFHSKWNELAPTYFQNTEQDYDMLFMGSQFEFFSEYHIDKGPVFCLHAYIITCEGAQQLLNYVTSVQAGGIYTIDTMLKVAMEWKNPPFKWLVWNAFEFPCPKAKMSTAWKKRNQGLVFQDEKFGTDIRVYKD